LQDTRAAGRGAHSAASLKIRFEALWNRCTLPRANSNPGPVWELLSRHYAESHRHYHTLRHLAHCFKQLDTVRSLMDDPDAVEVAIRFHDVVYEPGATDNERRSAALFERIARGCCERSFVHRVAKLILATTHRTAPQSRDAEVLCDIDLSSFGAPWDRFLSESAALRAEQPQSSDERFYAGKLVFLRALLERPAIFYTEFFRSRFESSARNNIRRYLARLVAHRYD
jgi:predicted metal-dependent HD superfamily phosphohydrolase